MEFNYFIRPTCRECPFKASGGGKCRALDTDVCQKDIWFHASQLELKNGIRKSKQYLKKMEKRFSFKDTKNQTYHETLVKVCSDILGEPEY